MKKAILYKQGGFLILPINYLLNIAEQLSIE